MAVLYTRKQIQDALKEISIRPVTGDMVTGEEAARILTWRAWSEQGVRHIYRNTAIRRHVERKHLRPYPMNTRMNRYKVEDIFTLPIVANRGLKQQKKEVTL